MASLPRALSIRPNAIGPTEPYFRGEPSKSEAFDRLFSDDSRVRVGIAWSGRGLTALDRARWIPLGSMLALAGSAVRLISAQKGSTSDDSATESQLLRLDNQIDDFLDLASLIDTLDLVISIDTATAHLAGAMGKPVWLLLPFVNDWRWLRDRHDSVWYPTMRVFRQRTRGDWSDVLRDVQSQLRPFIEKRAD
jgi:hypothetical protein